MFYQRKLFYVNQNTPTKQQNNSNTWRNRTIYLFIIPIVVYYIMPLYLAVAFRLLFFGRLTIHLSYL